MKIWSLHLTCVSIFPWQCEALPWPTVCLGALSLPDCNRVIKVREMPKQLYLDRDQLFPSAAQLQKTTAGKPQSSQSDLGLS